MTIKYQQRVGALHEFNDAVAKAKKFGRPQGVGKWSRSGPPGTCLCGLKVEAHTGACEACTCLMGEHHDYPEPVVYKGHVLCPHCFGCWQAYERLHGAVTWQEFRLGLMPTKVLAGVRRQ